MTMITSQFVPPVKLRPHKLQSKLYRTRARFPVVWGGRGSGKSEILKRRSIRYLNMQYPHVIAAGDIPRFFYGLPVYNQARRVAWEPLKRLIPKDWYEVDGQTFYEANMIIKTRFGTELHVVGLDNPQRIEGNQWCGGVLDESSDQKPGIFDRSVRPALTAFNGWCVRAGVPKRFGIGAEDFKKACELAMSGVDPDVEPYTWASSTVVDAKQLEQIKATTDAMDYLEQYEAQWGSVQGAIYHNFSEHTHVSQAAVYISDLPIVVGSDFNVDPMCWNLNHIIQGKLVTFDELTIRNTNTQATLDILYSKYGSHTAGWKFFGDAAAKARKTSATITDYMHIYNDKRFLHKEVFYFDSNPPIADRFAACNALLMNANGLSRVLINPCCTRLIADLTHRAYKPGTREPNDSGQLGHAADAWGYIISRVWPLQFEIASAPEIVSL